MNANNYAKRIASFIKENNISLEDYTMDQIVAGFYKCQLDAIEKAEKEYRKTHNI